MRDDDLPAIRRAGLLPAVLAVEALLASQEHRGAQRWDGMRDEELLDHADGHSAECRQGVETDLQTGHPTAAHLAVRGLMYLARVLRRAARG